ncbi:amino acid ABC transporter permease [Sphaerochaeta globosa]|uniref:Polar amino acid ABC transporter, inner membrane subunit n=1 Tax=Sphaerochaeta globosa (strain ATCC BAA-1886 / DSM 22777 / Buddy) TaxID=158189 RepID=F0RY09_SPHGB|nr:amino acid ABC transporter permease [Sphaerochaeta globosa]ADY12433.1 polar amino acid ABC transporter, inner membrane subunit [Sphaerochaeta globosa str. Buddy]
MIELFDPYSIPEVLVFLSKGLGMTLFIALISICLSFVFGSVLGIARYLGKGPAAKLAALYIDSVRNIPLLLFILSFRLLLPSVILGIRIPDKAVFSGIVAMTVFTSAMVAEILRGGLNGIPKGQWEAAASQGFSRYKTLRYIIFPQALRKILVPMLGQFVTCLKDTSFLQVVGISELMMNATIIMGKFKYSYQVILLYTLVALAYYGANSAVLTIAKRIKF